MTAIETTIGAKSFTQLKTHSVIPVIIALWLSAGNPPPRMISGACGAGRDQEVSTRTDCGSIFCGATRSWWTAGRVQDIGS